MHQTIDQRIYHRAARIAQSCPSCAGAVACPIGYGPRCEEFGGACWVTLVGLGADRDDVVCSKEMPSLRCALVCRCIVLRCALICKLCIYRMRRLRLPCGHRYCWTCTTQQSQEFVGSVVQPRGVSQGLRARVLGACCLALRATASRPFQQF